MRGFVLIELLIVLAILSVVFFYLTPTSVNLFKANRNVDVEKLNSVINMALSEAQESGFPQYIWGEKGSNNIHFGKRTVSLSGDVFSVKVNGKYQEGLEYRFRVYPCGVMDSVKMVLYGEKKLVSLPLLTKFSQE